MADGEYLPLSDFHSRDSVANEEALPKEFSDTEKAYGGEAVWQKAKDDGKTKLNYRQWVQVRTPRFKAWFGDWEALQAQKRLADMKPVDVQVPDDWHGLDTEGLRARVNAALIELVSSGEPLHHADIGDVSVAKRGVKKAVSSSADPAKLKVLGDLRNVFERSLFASAAPVRGSKHNVAAYEKLLAKITVDGHELVAVFSVEKHRDGRLFYNTVTLDGNEKAPVASPRDTLSQGEERATSANTGAASFSRRHLEKVNSDTVSKVVDPETGEPMVVFRGMTQELDQSQGTADRYYTSDAEVAGDYADPGRSIYDSDDSGGNIMPVFISAKNIKIERNINNVTDWSYDKNRLLRDGYDAVADKEMSVIVPVVADAQVKSAIGNTGAFDPKNNDIRYRSTDEGKGISRQDAEAVIQQFKRQYRGAAKLGFKLADTAEQLYGREALVRRGVYGQKLKGAYHPKE